MCFGGSGAHDIRRGRDRALDQLEKSYEGPIRGLQIAPEFYKLLSSPELKNTPLGRSLQLQNQILGEVSAGLGGSAFGARQGGRKGAGALPPDMVSAIGENLNSQMAASGTLGSPAGAIKAAMRFSGASEDIRAQRLREAGAALDQIGGASIMPSASQFLQVGANKASQAANIEQQAGTQIAGAKQAYYQEIGNAIGSIGGMALGGGFGGGAMSMLGGLFGGGGPQAKLNQRYAQGYRPPGAMEGWSPGNYYSGGNTPFGFGDQQYSPWGMMAGQYGPNYLTGAGF